MSTIDLSELTVTHLATWSAIYVEDDTGARIKVWDAHRLPTPRAAHVEGELMEVGVIRVDSLARASLNIVQATIGYIDTAGFSRLARLPEDLVDPT